MSCSPARPLPLRPCCFWSLRSPLADTENGGVELSEDTGILSAINLERPPHLPRCSVCLFQTNVHKRGVPGVTREMCELLAIRAPLRQLSGTPGGVGEETKSREGERPAEGHTGGAASHSSVMLFHSWGATHETVRASPLHTLPGLAQGVRSSSLCSFSHTRNARRCAQHLGCHRVERLSGSLGYSVQGYSPSSEVHSSAVRDV